MDDVSVQKMVFFIVAVDESLGYALNYKLVFGSGMTIDMEDVKQLKSTLLKSGNAEMEVHEAYTKSTQFMATDYNVTVNETFNHNVESWSLVLYLICFLVLIIFFLIISVLEVCCRRNLLNASSTENQTVEVSPPPYDLFGPPTYDSLYDAKCNKDAKQKRKCNIFVIHLPKRKNNFNMMNTGRYNSSVQIQGDVSPPPPP